MVEEEEDAAVEEEEKEAAVEEEEKEAAVEEEEKEAIGSIVANLFGKNTASTPLCSGAR